MSAIFDYFILAQDLKMVVLGEFSIMLLAAVGGAFAVGAGKHPRFANCEQRGPRRTLQLAVAGFEGVDVTRDAPKGLPLPVEASSPAMDNDGRSDFVMAPHDLSERRRAEEQILFLDRHDTPTGLCNRLELGERLSRMIMGVVPNQKKIAVFYIGIDRFNEVNELLGHEGGDALLIDAARRMKSFQRANDTIARAGATEFVVVQMIGDAADAAKISATRIIKELARPFIIAGDEITISASAGIALFPADGDTAADLLRNADKALYCAKSEARGSVCVFTPGIDYRLQRVRLLARESRHAVERGEMEVYYQPICDANGAVVGQEALLRWNHPEQGLVSPAEFIPIAEECGSIYDLGAWVLETACTAALTWPAAWRVAVNVSPIQFAREEFLQDVVDIVQRTGIEPGRIELEVTENMLIGDQAKALRILSALKQLGMHTALDDFGTGYSSLSYLNRFPFEKIKIDQSFVTGLGQAGDAEIIVRAIIALGHSLNMIVTAEGVETKSQFAVLRRLKCDQMQGYLLGRPMTKGDIDRQLLQTSVIASRPNTFERLHKPILNRPQVVHGGETRC